jgi:carboxyl-terminal processing protease
MDVAEADLDYPVDFDRVDQTPFASSAMVDANLVAELNARSGERRNKSEDFAKLERRIEQYQRQKAKKFVTLNEEKFAAERAEFDADKEEEASFKEQTETERPVFRRDYYNNEVLQIAADYVALLNGPKVAGN